MKTFVSSTGAFGSPSVETSTTKDTVLPTNMSRQVNVILTACAIVTLVVTAVALPKFLLMACVGTAIFMSVKILLTQYGTSIPSVTQDTILSIFSRSIVSALHYGLKG